ncbi:hypothetical protein AB4298_00685 [Shewanella sp. 10N.261.52.F9]|uniref:hypothetical protein n=1 Tax=Shewanella TaxID=22 RepID=UPI00200E244A|nr:hypothetical protein [Shewanella marinintestina]MCL1146869.1 hypothetical protein [Shewanella marinintestina]
MKQLTKLLSTTVNMFTTASKTVITLALALALSIGNAHASPNTAVTANLVKSNTEDNLLICQYRTISASHFQVFDKVLDKETSCPTNMQVSPEPMLTQAEKNQLNRMMKH